jgi:hypothetical protein
MKSGHEAVYAALPNSRGLDSEISSGAHRWTGSGEVYSFLHGKFYQGDAFLDGTPNLENMKAALVNAFRNPSFANENLKIWRWKWPEKQIEIPPVIDGNHLSPDVSTLRMIGADSRAASTDG